VHKYHTGRESEIFPAVSFFSREAFRVIYERGQSQPDASRHRAGPRFLLGRTMKTTTAPDQIAVTVRRGVTFEPATDGLAIAGPTWSMVLPSADPKLATALCEALAEARSPASVVREVAARTGSLAAVAATYQTLARLHGAGLLDRVVLSDGRVVARLTGEGSLPTSDAKTQDAPHLRLSKFAVITSDGESAALTSGRDPRRVEVDPVLLPDIVGGGLAAGTDWPSRGVRQLLLVSGLWVDPATEPDAGGWTPCELWFHQRTAEWRGSDRYGGTYRVAGDPAPYATPVTGRLVSLDVPDLASRERTDPPLVEVIERRRSVRRLATPSIAQVGELLYRSCRVRGSFHDRGLEVVDRPYPSGGSIHELETYLMVSECEGIEPGLWRYVADRHALELISADTARCAALAQDIGAAGELPGPPPIGIVVSARFGRLMWKYETMAYALILKNVGVLYQTLYLNAYATGLGVCGLGGMSTYAFERASGRDPRAEGMVGAMLLGVPTESEAWS
jgi:SagB-type dehydrogenase family enzyme